MSLWHLFSGTMTLRLTCAAMEEILLALAAQGIEIRRLERTSELVCSFTIARTDWKRCRSLIARHGGKATVYKRTGLFWPVTALKRRPVLLLGTGSILLLTLLLPEFCLFFQVNGNRQVSARQILEAAQESGLYFGVSRRALRSEQVKNQLLEQIPELSWAGVNTAGCVARISVRERPQTPPVEDKGGISHIVAVRDGFILSGTTLRGTALFQPGQTVTAGQTLISGYTDSGICLRATRAEGEVWAQTLRDLTVLTPKNCLQKGQPTGLKRKISLLIRKKRINLWKDSGISPVTCGRMYEEYYVTLPGGFVLPFALCVDTYTQYETLPVSLEESAAEYALTDFAGRYLPQQMAAGNIRQGHHTLSEENGAWCLQGQYVCEEMISRQQIEQIGEWNGKER